MCHSSQKSFVVKLVKLTKTANLYANGLVLVKNVSMNAFKLA